MTEIREYNMEALGTEKKKNRLIKNLIIFTCIIAGIILLAFLGSVIKNAIWGEDQDISASGPYIATIYVEGSIAAGQRDTFGLPVGYQHNWTLEKIDELIADPNNRGLILFVDSPGGGVYESDELYLSLKEYKEMTDRPVYAVMGSMAASGGYYISAPADKIVANRNTWTGSIGVTNAYEQFTGIISEERGIDLNEVKKLADGRIYTAEQALALNLVDSIGTFDEALDEMVEEYELYNCAVIDVVYKDNSLWGSLLGGVNIPDLKGGDVTAILKTIEGDSKFPISYECELLK